MSSDLQVYEEHKGALDLMHAAMCWRIMGSKPNEADVIALFARFNLGRDEAEAVATFCRLIASEEIDEEASDAIRNTEATLLSATIMAKGQVLADPHTALNEIYRPKATYDQDALF